MPYSYNGTFSIASVPSVNTFTYLFDGATAATATGTITAFFESDETNVTEIPAPILTDDMRQWIQIKTMTNPLVTNVYFNATYAGGLATIELWPIPTVSEHALVLYRPMQLSSFANVNQQVDLPDGAEEAIEYNLAVRFIAPNGVDAETAADVRDLARTTLGTFKRGNTKLSDVVLDPMFTMGRRGGYNILTGGNTGGGRS